MTQTAVARQAGLSRSFYTQVEHARQAISVDRAFAIATVLGVEMTELFTAFPAVPHARPYYRTPAPARYRDIRSPAASASAPRSNGLSCQPPCPASANLHAQTR